jgi:hypothetical protein
LILNPWAENPLTDLDLTVDQHVPDGDLLIKRDGKSLGQLYGLSDEWPE